jgi:hypothetical protein
VVLFPLAAEVVRGERRGGAHQRTTAMLACLCSNEEERWLAGPDGPKCCHKIKREFGCIAFWDGSNTKKE